MLKTLEMKQSSLRQIRLTRIQIFFLDYKGPIGQLSLNFEYLNNKTMKQNNNNVISSAFLELMFSFFDESFFTTVGTCLLNPIVLVINFKQNKRS